MFSPKNTHPNQLIFNWWFGILGVPLCHNPFQKGILGIQTTKPNHHLTLSWRNVPIIWYSSPLQGNQPPKRVLNVFKDEKIYSCCWWFRNPAITTLEHNIKPVVDNGINYQPQLVIARFLNQQYDSYPSSDLPAHVASLRILGNLLLINGVTTPISRVVTHLWGL